MSRFRFATALSVPSLALLAAACGNGGVTSTKGPITITPNPCAGTGTLSLQVAAATTISCSAGGTTLTFSGNGASYLIVPQFATENASLNYIEYRMFTGNVAAASASISRLSTRRAQASRSSALAAGALPRARNLAAQHAFEKLLRTRAAHRPKSSIIHPAALRRIRAQGAPPPVGSLRSFFVANSFTVDTYSTVGARLAYAGSNVLLYVDTLAPANGFTPAQLTSFGQYFDQTMYPIDTGAFGGPSDVDENGHAIMLMSPVVNALTPSATCQNQGFIAGFFDSNDFTTDATSNQGEIFYSIVPDTTGQFSCAHGAGEVGLVVPSTFLHELQHLINFSQHVVISGSNPSTSWMDEGLSIVAEELGSVYYEQKYPCPGAQCPAPQLFPDSSQGFIQDFLYDSYFYAYLPDTATITLSNDGEQGFSWRGGAWLFARWIGDQHGTGFYKQLEQGPSDIFTSVQQLTGQSFATAFANFGLALYTDSLPGLPRTTAPAANRFATRNMRQLWERLYTSSGGSYFPLAEPVQLFAITNDTSTAIILPGTMTYFRLDTPATEATVTIQFSSPSGSAFAPSLAPQIAIFRLPPGQ